MFHTERNRLRWKRSAKNGNILLPLISVIALISLVAAGYFFYQNQKYQGEALGPYTPTNAPTPAPTTRDETANWKTYTNNKYMYSFQYPNGYFVNELDSWIYVIKRQMEQEEFMRLTHGLPGSLEILTTHVEGKSATESEASFNESLKKYAEPQTLKTVGGTPWATVEKIEFDGITALKQDAFAVSDIPTGGTQTIIIFFRNGAQIQISYPNPKNPGYNKDYDQILSTFHFLK